MSHQSRLSRMAHRLSFLPVTLAALAGMASSAAAQTAPQLLPYTSKLIAGGGTATIAAGATCPVSGYTSLDAYGDGCLATEIEIGNVAAGAATPGSRSAIADASGNVFFTDFNNALVRRVDATTGIVTAVAGGATASPATGVACGSNLSLDVAGDGCLGTAVKLTHPVGLAFAPNGDLYFTDLLSTSPYFAQVRKIAATAGAITSTGVISLAAGNVSGTVGYAASTPTTTITSANSYLRAPYGIAFDSKGDLFIVDEYTEAILALNTNATGTNTVNTVPIPAGQIWKIAGTTTGSTAPYCPNGSGTSGVGCSYALYTENAPANSDSFDSTYDVAVDTNGTVYGADEYYNAVFKVTSAGVLSTFAGKQNAVGVKPTIGNRGPAGSFGIGSIFGLAADASNNIYITDASSGVIWRVDGATQSMYVVAGGATTTCTAATDTLGDGCPATQAKLGNSQSSAGSNYVMSALPGPGVYHVSVDPYSDLFLGDTETNLVREIASGTQFGPVGANQPTQIVDVHFTANDSPAASAYKLTSGTSNFTLGTATCTTNSDKTTDCLLPVTATPSVLGPFTGTLQVTSVLGGVGTFPLSGTFVQSPITRTSATATAAGCSGSTTYATTATITLSAALVANGPSAPGGTISFTYNGATPVPGGTAIKVTNIGTTANPVYGATLPTTFTTPGTYTITATYSGDSYFKGSSGVTSSFSTSLPGYTVTQNTSGTVVEQGCAGSSQCIVAAGQTALFSFNVVQNVYSGTISYSCSGLPSNSACVFSPQSITGTGCSATSVVALSITTQAVTVAQGGFGSGMGRWQMFSVLAGLGLAMLIGLRRRKLNLRYGQLWMALALLLASSGILACKAANTGVNTPSGSYTVNVTFSGSTGSPVSVPVTLVVK